MKRYFSLVLVILLGACGDFDDMNVNPNLPTKVPTSGFLTNAINGMYGYESATQGLLYAQYWSETRSTTASRYNTQQFDFTGAYSAELRDLDEIIRLNTSDDSKAFAAESGSNKNQVAVAEIMKAYFFLHVTDRWGSIPYGDALNAQSKVITPKYDGQKEIYGKLFLKLKDAIKGFDDGAMPKGDILFAGTDAQRVDKWKKFANSVRLRMALRLSKVDPAMAKTEFASAYADGVISSNLENSVYKFLGDGNFNHPAYNLYAGGRIDFAVSNTLVDFLKDRNDPRLDVYADVTKNKLPANKYLGMPYGLTEQKAGTFPYDSVSLPNSVKVRGKNSVGFILTYAQVLFTLAEGVQRNYITGDAKKLYEDGIKASMEQWGADVSTYASYIAQPKVAFTVADAERLIAEQKWIASYMNGYEAWAEWRRTDFPALTPAPAALNQSKQIPRRQAYPASEANNNSVNYLEAVGSQGADGLDTRLWWDK